jgi:hypothetical protein
MHPAPPGARRGSHRGAGELREVAIGVTTR